MELGPIVDSATRQHLQGSGGQGGSTWGSWPGQGGEGRAWRGEGSWPRRVGGEEALTLGRGGAGGERTSPAAGLGARGPDLGAGVT